MEEKKKKSLSLLLSGICPRRSARAEGFRTQQPLPQHAQQGQQSPPLSLVPQQDQDSAWSHAPGLAGMEAPGARGVWGLAAILPRP